MANKASALRIKQVRSTIGRSKKQREVLKTLGLRRIGHVVERPDNAAVRGAVGLVAHLVSIEGDTPADEPVVIQEKKDDVEAAAAGKPAEKKAEKKTKKKTTKKKKKTKTKKKTKKKAAKKKTAKAGAKKKAEKKSGGGEQ